MTPSFQNDSYMLIRIAETGDRFADFGPYVASINNEGIVAFQATLRDGNTGVYTSAGEGAISTIEESGNHSLREICSHPDINESGACCFYANRADGVRGVFLARGGEMIQLADSSGLLGPTMNDAGAVAFRANVNAAREGIFTICGKVVKIIATTGQRFAGFQGLPVINRSGAVVFRAALTSGGQGIYVGDGIQLATIVETGELFRELGSFPIMNDAGVVAFCGTMRPGISGVFVASEGKVETLVDSTNVFESFRGVLLNNSGRIIFYASPRGQALGVFSGTDEDRHRIIAMGMPLLGSTVIDFALNPVSINDAGQLAIRVKLADQRQFIMWADPVSQ